MIKEEYLKILFKETHQTNIENNIYNFAKESNCIEGILDEKRHLEHAAALNRLLKVKKIKVSDIIRFVSKIEPSAYLRKLPTDNVWIGGKQAPDAITSQLMLNDLLMKINKNLISPYEGHCGLEVAHPLSDCNGRSLRAVWLWHMTRFYNYDLRYIFLRMFYYQSLQYYRDNILKIRINKSHA